MKLDPSVDIKYHVDTWRGAYAFIPRKFIRSDKTVWMRVALELHIITEEDLDPPRFVLLLPEPATDNQVKKAKRDFAQDLDLQYHVDPKTKRIVIPDQDVHRGESIL